MKRLITYLIVCSSLLLITTPSTGQQSENGRSTKASAFLPAQDQEEKEEGIHFHGNFPNPVKTETRFKFEIDRELQVFITVYDLLGNEVKQVTNDTYQAGVHKVKFDASNLDQGVYFYSFKAGDLKITKRLSKVSD